MKSRKVVAVTIAAAATSLSLFIAGFFAFNAFLSLGMGGRFSFSVIVQWTLVVIIPLIGGTACGLAFRKLRCSSFPLFWVGFLLALILGGLLVAGITEYSALVVRLALLLVVPMSLVPLSFWMVLRRPRR